VSNKSGKEQRDASHHTLSFKSYLLGVVSKDSFAIYPYINAKMITRILLKEYFIIISFLTLSEERIYQMQQSSMNNN
jgi:hypothetical protein